MPDHLELTPHMTQAGSQDEAIVKTFLGQAHLAGTGPEGTTCRECIWWKMSEVHRWKRPEADKPGKWQTYTPGSYNKDGSLRRHSCTRPILNKAKRRFPHTAKACRLFSPAESPLPITKASNG